MATNPHAEYFRQLETRAKARLNAFTPMTVQERQRSLRSQGFRPHGLYLPSDETTQLQIKDILMKIGNISDVDERHQAYFKLQDMTESLETRGVPGRWTGQQAVARSNAQFRIVAWGRRSGKSVYAANEAVAVIRNRPRSWVWVAAPTMLLVGRCFDMIEQMLQDLGEELLVHQNSTQHKLLVLKRNGSKVEGISLENVQSAAGAAVDFAIIDEAAQIDPEAWYRAILPPLADRNGQALMISSWEGEGDFFHTKAMEAQADIASRGEQSDWAFFQDATWDINFFMFPQGERSPAIERARREMDPVDFLEQFGAIPAKARGRVFPEFREKVHVGDWPYNPKHPVICAADPSGGHGEYAIVAVQDYKDYMVVIDEFYEKGATVEEAAAILDKRPWRENVVELIVDPAPMISEVERWVTAGWPAYPVPDKPQVEARLPLYRNLLRNPARYHILHRQMMNKLLKEEGLPENADMFMSPEEQRLWALRVEKALSGPDITDGALRGLRACSKVFINRGCYWTIQEHKLYSYPKQRKGGILREKPLEAYNHLMDCLGYVTWVHHRNDDLVMDMDPVSLVDNKTTAMLGPELLLPRPATDLPGGSMGSFLAEQRSRYEKSPYSSRSLVKTRGS